MVGIVERKQILLGLAVLACVGAVAGAQSAPGGAQSAKSLKFIMVPHAPASDPFWHPVANGFRQAGADLGVSTEYRGTKGNLSDPNEQRRLIEAAIAAKPAGLIVSDPAPKSLNEVIKKASAQMPVILVNAGISEVQNTGAMTIVANDEYRTGLLGGLRLKALGGKRALVLITPRGQFPPVDQRFDGFKKGFGGTLVTGTVPLSKITDTQFLKNLLQAKLLKDKGIDAAFSMGSALTPVFLSVKAGLGARGTKIHWGAIDLIPALIPALQKKAWAFALDQQQFAQGYLPVVLLNLYVKYGIEPGSDFISTGPGFVTPQNVDRIAALQKQGVR